MNPFFDISKDHNLPEDALPLKDLGPQQAWLTVGRRGSDFWSTSGSSSKTTYRDTTAEDYDQQFIRKLMRWKPVYKISQVVDHHYYYYLDISEHLQHDFLQHMRYVILPALKKKPNSEVCAQLLEEWLNDLPNRNGKNAPVNHTRVLSSITSNKHSEPYRKVFISYAKEDYKYAVELYDYLQHQSYEPWLDKKCLLAGSNWDMEIKKALKKSDFIILLLSSTSVSKRGYVQREYKLALQYWEERVEDDIYIIPVLINDCEVPVSLNRFQWLQYDEDAFALIVQSLNVQRAKLTGQAIATAVTEPFIPSNAEIEMIRKSQLDQSRKVHDVVANGLYRIMSDLDHRDTIDKNQLLNQLEKIYEHSRDICDNGDISTEDFSSALSQAISAFATADCRIAVVGNAAAIWKGANDKAKHDMLQIIQLLLNVFVRDVNAANIQLKFNRTGEQLNLQCQYDGDIQLTLTNLNNIQQVILAANGTLSFVNKRNGARIDVLYLLQYI